MDDRELRVFARPPERLTAWLSATAPRGPAIRVESRMWLVLDVDPGQPAEGMAVDVSHAYSAFGIEGAAASELLSRGIALDLERLAPGFAGRTRLGDVAVILARTPGGFVLRCERSYAEWMACWLDRARTIMLSIAGT